MSDRPLTEDAKSLQLERESRRAFLASLPRSWNTYSPETDLGTDFILEVGSENHRGPRRLEVQLKATEGADPEDGLRRRMKVSTVNSLLRSPLPVLVVLYDASSETLYWTDLRAYARNRSKEQGTDWQDHRTISVPFETSRHLASDEDFSAMVGELLTSKEWGIDDLEDVEHQSFQAAHEALLNQLLELSHDKDLPASEALNLLAKESNRDLDAEDLKALLTQHAEGLIEHDSSRQLISLVDSPTTAGIRSVLSLHGEGAPTTLRRLGWLSSIASEDMGYLLDSLRPEDLDVLHLLRNLEEVDETVWLSVVMRLLVDNPDRLRDLPDTTLTEETPRQPEKGATGVIRELEFDPKRWGSTIRAATPNNPGDGVVVVPAGNEAYLVETEALSPDEELPSLSVRGVKEGPIETRTPELVFPQPEARRLTRVIGRLNHPNHPALRILTSGEGGDFKAPEIQANRLIQLPDQKRIAGYGDDGTSFVCSIDGFVFFELVTEVSIDDEILPGPLPTEIETQFRRGEIDIRVPLYERPRHPGIPAPVIEFFEDRGIRVELDPRSELEPVQQ